jgi:predicted ATP-grasp superfamily ATP-dependent carboligase
MKKVLIYEANASQALALTKFIQKYSNYYIVGCVEKNIRFNQKDYDEIIIQSFDSIDISLYDYILPMGANTSFSIVEKFEKINFCNNIYMDTNNLVVYDKPKMLSIVDLLNIPTPETWDKIENIQKFPLFYKEDFENGGGVRGVAQNIDQVPHKDRLIYQEYISTPSTYGVGFLAHEGNILTYIMHKEVISFPKDGGSSVVIESFSDERLLGYTKTIIKHINYNGWGLAEFKYCDKREDFVFMEVNAKFWASIEFMLVNNPQFLNNLLGIHYDHPKADKMVFINRLLQYSIWEVIENMHYFFIPYKITESSIVYQLVRKLIPTNFVNLIKVFIK